MSLSDEAYVAIKRMIVTLELAPDAVVDEATMQSRLNIGRTPIREAIQRLERDQFVEVKPRRGVFVTPVDQVNLSLLFETRSVIEPYAARLATVRGAGSLWDEMQKVIEAADTSSPTDMLAADRRCHELMWEGASNRFLTDTLDMLYAQSERVWFFYVKGGAEMHNVLDEHTDMLNALRSGDADLVGALMETHVRSFHDEIRSLAN